tara:strand:+ start:905 stop:1474 length:570 start_codon:yes stop_codon:yes gene_type:complete
MEIGYRVYHYGDNKLDDTGWGCSYRNIQTILSCYKILYNDKIDIPDIRTILIFFNKNANSINKRDLWLEPYHIGKYIADKFNINGKHYAFVTDNYDFSKILKTDISFYLENNRIINRFDTILSIIKEHFRETNLPVVIDDGIYSYCFIMNGEFILLIDPHSTEKKLLKKNISYLENKFLLYYFPSSIKG